MEEYRKVVVVGIIIITLVAGAITLYYFLRTRTSLEKGPEGAKAEPALEELSQKREVKSLDFLGISLAESDSLIRKLARELSSHPKLEKWLQSDQLIRKFTAAVDNIANGLSPRPQIDFFAPRGEFRVEEKDGKLFLSPETYNRYDQVADIFLSLDTEACVRLYRQAKPLIQEAYRELGYPEKDFDDTLFQAIVELLQVPVVEREIVLRKELLTYVMVESELEKLSEAQKHLLRMGPENVRIIQGKLKELAIALGFPEEKLPRTRIY